MLVLSIDEDDPVCETFLAAAGPLFLEDVTLRPIIGLVILCHLELDPESFESDLTTTVHEVLHALVRFQTTNP